MLTLEARDAAFCNGTYGNDAGGAHEDWHFTGELTGSAASENLTLANNVFDRFEPVSYTHLFLEKAARRACSNARAGPRHNDNFVCESIHYVPDEFYERSERQWAIDLGQKNYCALVG